MSTRETAPVSSFSRQETPQVVIPPYGEGAPGQGRYGAFDPTRDLWSRVKDAAAATWTRVQQALPALLLALLVTSAKAADPKTTNYNFLIPTPNVIDRTRSWGDKNNENWERLDAILVGASTVTATSPLLGNGTVASPLRLGAVPAVNIDLSTVTTALNSVAVSTQAIAIDTGAISARLGNFIFEADTATVLSSGNTAYFTAGVGAEAILKGGTRTVSTDKWHPAWFGAFGGLSTPSGVAPKAIIYSGAFQDSGSISTPSSMTVQGDGIWLYPSGASGVQIGGATPNLTAGGTITAPTFVGNLTGNLTGAATITGPLTVQNIVGPTTVSASSLTVAGAFQASQSSAPAYFVGLNGTAAGPSIAGPQTNTGILFSGTDMLFSANGTTRGSVVTGIGICGGTGATTGQFCLRSSAGDKSDPAGQFTGDANTGFYRSAADDWRLVAGGVDLIRLQSNQVNLMPFTAATSTFSATVGLAIPSSVTASAFFGTSLSVSERANLGSLAMSGSTSTITTGSSVTASGFFGDGSHLTGLIAGVYISSGASTGGVITNFPQQSVQNILLSTAGFTYDVTGSTGVLGVKGLQIVASTVVYPSGTSTQTSLVNCIANSTATWTQGNNKALICFAGSFSSGGSGTIGQATALVDGLFVAGATSSRGSTSAYCAGQNCTMSFCVETETLAAGTHNACLAMAADVATTVTVPAAVTKNSVAQMSVIELATGGQGYAAPASTEIVSGTAFSIANVTAWTTVTAMSSSVTVTGQVAQVTLNCGWARSGGAFVSKLSSRIVRDDSAEIIVLPDLGGDTASQSTNLTLPISTVHLSTGLASGQHSWTYQVKTTANADTWTEQPSACRLNAVEVRNAPGTGDMSSNGTTSVTGTLDLGLARATNWTFFRQEVSSRTVDFFSKDTPGNTAIPHDDTQPLLSTEGMRVLTATMTAKIAVSTVVVEGVVMGCESSNLADYGTACIYSDANQTPLCCSAGRFLAEIEPLRISVGPCKTWPGDTASHVYTLKFGMNVANVAAVNGCTARQYGGALQTTLTVKEQAGPQ